MAEEESNSSRGCMIPLVLLIAPFALAFLLPPRNPLGSILGVVWILVCLPVAFMLFLDWFRSSPKTGARRMLRSVAWVPVFAMGATAVLFGVSILVWVAYNLLWQRQPGFRMSAGVRGLGVPVVLVLFVLYLVRLSLSPSEPGTPPR